MAQREASVLLVGNVVKSERRKGSFTNDRGENVEYDFILAKFLAPEYEAYDVRFPSKGIDVPAPDEQVTLRCAARTAGGDTSATGDRDRRQHGGARLDVGAPRCSGRSVPGRLTTWQFTTNYRRRKAMLDTHRAGIEPSTETSASPISDVMSQRSSVGCDTAVRVLPLA